MNVQKNKISSLLYDFIEIQKSILFDKEEVIKYKDELRDFAINLCKSIDFKDLDIKTFDYLANKDIEYWSEEDNIDYSINDGKRYYRIEFNANRKYNFDFGIDGIITILNKIKRGGSGYRIDFRTIKLKKEYCHARIINGVRIDEYLNGKVIKSDTVKINRHFVAGSIYNLKQDMSNF